jgi:glucose-induced degradation protein 4
MPSSSAMPSEHPPPHTQQLLEQPQQQNKVCSACHRPLSGDSNTPPLLLHDGEDASDTSIICLPCRQRNYAVRLETSPVSTARGEVLFAQVERELRRRAASLQTGDNEANPLHQHGESVICPPAQLQPDRDCRDDEDLELESPVTPPAHRLSISGSEQGHHPSFIEGSSYGSSIFPQTRQPLTIVVNHGAAGLHQSQAPISSLLTHSPVTPTPWASSSRVHSAHAAAHPDPLVDITRLRVPSQGHHCLYPGAIFKGTQKSGRNSYDVSVTIVVSNFPKCVSGLRIRVSCLVLP